jgi:hypothetical protein
MRHLGDAERWIRTGADIIARQRRLVTKLSERGVDVAKARQWLAKFEDMQNAFVAHRAIILRELDAGPRSG